jgi:hypothetical protein
MNSAKILPAIFVLFFIACTQPQSKQPGNITDTMFDDYIKSLDTIPLPFKHSCSDAQFAEMSVHFDSAGFKKYKEADCIQPLGILFNDDTIIVTVDLSNADFCKAPFLVSFDKKGNKLDSLNLYQNAFADTDAASRPYFRVDKDKSIVIIDTTKKWKVGQFDKVVPGSETTTIDSTMYFLSEKGKFIKGPRKKL